MSITTNSHHEFSGLRVLKVELELFPGDHACCDTDTPAVCGTVWEAAEPWAVPTLLEASCA
mgnify:FL=1